MAEQEAVVTLLQTVIWAGTCIVIFAILSPMVKFCVKRLTDVREKEIAAEQSPRRSASPSINEPPHIRMKRES
jgi:hypothetical protein